MQRGYIRRQERRLAEVATIQAAIYNTIPRRKGAQPFTASDFMPKDKDEHTPEEKRKMAEDQINRFSKGVIIKEYGGR